MSKQQGPRDVSLASPDLFGGVDSDDDLWLNEIFEGENDPEVLQQVVSAIQSQAKDQPSQTGDVENRDQSSEDVLELDSDEDSFQAGQGGYVLTPSHWNAYRTPVTTWNLSPVHLQEEEKRPEPEKKKPLPRDKGEPSKPARATKRKRETSLESDGAVSMPLPRSAAASLSWAELLHQHDALLASKGKVNGRKFNKTALDLLNWCASKVKQHPGLLENPGPLLDGANEWQPGPIPSTSSAPEAGAASKTCDWEGEKEALSEFRSLLLNAKEIQSQEMIARVVAYIQKGLPPLLTADEKRDLLLKRSLAFVQELSPQLSLKTSPVIRSYVNQIFDAHLDNLFAEIRMPEKSARDKAIQYRRMFCRFIDDRSCVTFACTNKSLLGRLPPRDVWFLTFFAFVTSRRVRGDNLLQLGCVGLY